MGHAPKEPEQLDAAQPPPVKDTKERRNRKPETTAWLCRVWATGLSPLEVPPRMRRIRSGYKLLAAALEERRDFLLWAGHRRDDNRAVLERVVMLVARDRTSVGGAERERLDRLHRVLEAALDQLSRPVWNGHEQRYCADEAANRIVANLKERADTRRYVSGARDWLRDDYAKCQERGAQLDKEIAEGTSLPLETKLRSLVRSMKKRGDLPAGKPMENSRYTTVADVHFHS